MEKQFHLVSFVDEEDLPGVYRYFVMGIWNENGLAFYHGKSDEQWGTPEAAFKALQDVLPKFVELITEKSQGVLKVVRPPTDD